MKGRKISLDMKIPELSLLQVPLSCQLQPVLSSAAAEAAEQQKHLDNAGLRKTLGT